MGDMFIDLNSLVQFLSLRATGLGSVVSLVKLVLGLVVKDNRWDQVASLPQGILYFRFRKGSPPTVLAYAGDMGRKAINTVALRH